MRQAINSQILADQRGTYSQLTQLEAQHEVEIYNSQLRALEAKRALLEGDKLSDPNAIKQVNAQIENLERDHASKLIKIFADVVAGVNGLSFGQGTTFSFTDQFQKAEDAAQALGITLQGTLAGDVETAAAAVRDLGDAVAAGTASDRDYLRGKLQQVSAEIAFAKAAGQSTKALEAQKRDLQSALGVGRAYTHEMKSAADAIGSAIVSSAEAWGQGSVTIVQAMRDIAAAVIEGIASIAEKKGAEQLAEAFGAWPDWAGMASHFESAALWFALAGAVSAGAGATRGGGGRGGAGSSAGGGYSGPGLQSPQQVEQQPVQVVNVDHFEHGGLLTKRTLAMIGDAGIGSQREVILPLGNDSRALDEIAGRISERMPGGGAIHHHWDVHIDGVISGDNLHKVMREMSASVSRGTGRLQSSNSIRVTKRS